MAQTGYTPILIYSSSTGSAAPVAGNLINSTLGSELAINITDGKLFYKDNANAIQVIAWKTTPTTAGGTGLTTYAAGDLLYYATGTTLSKLGIGANTTVLTSSGSAPQWTAQSALSVGQASNLKSNATTGVMQIVGPAAGSTRVMTIPDANFTSARTDAAQSFTGTQTFTGLVQINRTGATFDAINFTYTSVGTRFTVGLDNFNTLLTLYNGAGTKTVELHTSGTSILSGGDVNIGAGNLIIGTSGKGIDFSATPGTGTSELLADYEEGTWTPTDASGAGLTLVTATGFYTKVGRVVYWQANIDYPVTANGSNALIGGLPFTITEGSSPGRAGSFITATTVTSLVQTLQITPTEIRLYKTGFVRNTNAELSGGTIYMAGFYIV